MKAPEAVVAVVAQESPYGTSGMAMVDMRHAMSSTPLSGTTDLTRPFLGYAVHLLGREPVLDLEDALAHISRRPPRSSPIEVLTTTRTEHPGALERHELLLAHRAHDRDLGDPSAGLPVVVAETLADGWLAAVPHGACGSWFRGPVVDVLGGAPAPDAHVVLAAPPLTDHRSIASIHSA